MARSGHVKNTTTKNAGKAATIVFFMRKPDNELRRSDAITGINIETRQDIDTIFYPLNKTVIAHICGCSSFGLRLSAAGTRYREDYFDPD